MLCCVGAAGQILECSHVAVCCSGSIRIDLFLPRYKLIVSIYSVHGVLPRKTRIRPDNLLNTVNDSSHKYSTEKYTRQCKNNCVCMMLPNKLK